MCRQGPTLITRTRTTTKTTRTTTKLNHLPLEGLKDAKANRRLGHLSDDQNREAPVETQGAVPADRLLDDVDDACVASLGTPLVKLKLRLDVLRRIGDDRLEGARQAASEDALELTGSCCAVSVVVA